MSTAHEDATRTFRTHIEIPAEKRAQLIDHLNQSLANSFDLLSQTKQAHWNVKGKDFYQLHLLFDMIAGELVEFVDLFAERVTSLGGYATGTARMAAANSELPEYPTDAIEGKAHVAALVERFGRYAAHLRAGGSTSPTSWATPPPPTSTPRSPATSTSGSGSLKPTFRAEPRDGLASSLTTDPINP